MNKIALSVDLDDLHHIENSFSYNIKNNPIDKSPEVRFDHITEPTKRILKYFNKYNVKATFFIIADMIDMYPELVSLLKESDHEIGHHSLSHFVPIHRKNKIQIQTPEEWENDLIKAKSKIENAFKKNVIGYRAPGAYFADWMIPLLKKNGFKYDSSIASNSFYNKTNFDIQDIPRNPYYIDDTGKPTVDNKSLLEIPWPHLKLFNIRFPGGGAFFFRLMGYNYFRILLRQTLKTGDTVFYLHSHDISDEIFPIKNDRSRPFYWLNKGKKTENNLIKLMKEFNGVFTTCKEVYLRNK